LAKIDQIEKEVIKGREGDTRGGGR
jgi:hypothetical protein